MIPYGRQDITDQDIDSVISVLKSDLITQGNAVPAFEKKIADYVGVSNAIAVNSATSALHLSCMALGIGKGDLVWTSPITFVASANCALYCGANIDFVDIDEDTYNLCPLKLEEKLKVAKSNNLLPKAVIPVHLTGQSCDMEKIHMLSKEYGFYIIEDGSHAIGAEYNKTKVGSCAYSDICVFSFHPVKIITTGEGGMALTNNDEIASKIERLRSHGITRDENIMNDVSHGPWYYEQHDLGLNYRITDIQAALGISQMDRLDEYVEQRNIHADRYDSLLKDLPIQTPYQDQLNYSSRHLYVIRLKLDKISLTHKEVFESLRKNNIGVQLHYIPVPIQPYYSNMGFSMKEFPNSNAYYQEAISIPMFPTMTIEQQDTVISNIKKILSR